MIDTLIARYVEALKVEHYALRTCEYRHWTLHEFLHWLDERELEHIHDITPIILERYQRHLYHYRQVNDKPLSLATQRNRLTIIKHFFKWLTRKRIIPYNPSSELQLPRRHKSLPKATLSARDIKKLFTHVLHDGEYGLRDRAMVETFYATGVRRNELVHLNLDDIDLDRQTLMIRRGKGNKDRLLPIHAQACHWVTRYQQELRPQLIKRSDHQRLFVNDHGSPYHPSRLSEYIKRCLQRAGINKEGACHLFRHTVATQMLENGADIRFIQELLGHANIATTQIYTHIALNTLKEVYLNTHPAGQSTPE